MWDDQGNQVTDTYDISTAQMNYYYFQLSQFNQDEAEYFGVVAPYWTSKRAFRSRARMASPAPWAAIKVLCSIDRTMMSADHHGIHAEHAAAGFHVLRHELWRSPESDA